MYNSKLITQPFVHGEVTNKSRHVTGLHKWARTSRLVGTLMLILGWFTIPFEVILRRDFGQRWFTPINFYLGLLLVFVFALLQETYVAVWGRIQSIFSYIGFISSVTPKEELQKAQTDMMAIMGYFLLAYVLMGLYHLFKIKWRNQSNTPIHSYDDGTSRLRWLGIVLMWVLNVLSIPYMAVCFLLIPRKQRQGKTFPVLISNQQAFTDVFVEPALIFTLAYNTSQIVSFWLYLSGFAVLVHAHWKEMARRNKMLDFQDGKVEAELMRELRNSTAQEKAQQAQWWKAAKGVQPNLQPASQTAIRYPDLMGIIEEMNREKGHLAR
ncbi:hypothetical protein [Mucilaginibacter flavidus]|uniref:hypothetical protein n=1 Tax=Mucilaginibacter flavidus TaxID=2949309 RepID=UPI0020930A30|nr:hypothetical protein [Mucilaginibacter flavidus]MCO5946722.1 hypothetical protein [Mucilaginibacter flavidus]